MNIQETMLQCFADFNTPIGRWSDTSVKKNKYTEMMAFITISLQISLRVLPKAHVHEAACIRAESMKSWVKGLSAYLLCIDCFFHLSLGFLTSCLKCPASKASSSASSLPSVVSLNVLPSVPPSVLPSAQPRAHLQSLPAVVALETAVAQVVAAAA